MFGSVFFSFVLIVMTSVVIDCQSLHFCDALKANNWTISYSFSIPNGTHQKKLIVIKDHYWQLEYKPNVSTKEAQSSDTIAKHFAKGSVHLKDVWSNRSDVFSGHYDLACSMRHGHSYKPWEKTAIVLFNFANKSLDWILIGRNDNIPANGLTKETFPMDFGVFKPTVTYVSYSRMNKLYSTVVFLEQTKTGKQSPKYSSRIQAYFTPDMTETKTLKNETNSESISTRAVKTTVVPVSLNETTDFWKLKGLFGVLEPIHGDNGTLFLIESCADMYESPCIKTPVVYRYCVADEKDNSAMTTTCHPGRVTKNILIDCSSFDYRTPSPELQTSDDTDVISTSQTTESDGPTESETESSIEPVVSELITPKLSEQKADESEKGTDLLWIILIIIIIIVIMAVLMLCFIFGVFGKKAVKKTAKHSAGANTSSAGGPIRSNAGLTAVPNKNYPKKLSVPSDMDSLALPSTRSKVN